MPQKVIAIDMDDKPQSNAMSKKSTTKNKKRWWQKLGTKRGRLIVGGLGLLLMVVAGGLYWYVQSQPESTIARHLPIIPTPTPEVPSIPNPLNGVLYTKSEAEEHADRRVMAVMVENHVEARPQSGLADAEVIYEALAEGGITRFMGLYLHNTPQKITPIRSARLHFVNWAAEYDSIYAHWGGSAESLAYLRGNNQPKDLDQFIYGSAFYRDTSSGRSLEHTGATSMDNLRQVASSNGWEQGSNFESWKFTDDAPAEDRPDSHSVGLNFSGTFGYAARFDYRPESNDYIRFTGNQPHMDANGQQLSAKTIVLLTQSVQPYVDDSGNPAVRVTTIGEGQAVVIKDGTAHVGTWRKNSVTGRTQLLGQNGQPMQLNRGKLWVISTPIGGAVSY